MSGIVSFAQNFEDVLLYRALGHIEKGTYIDVGAQHPVLDSVSKAFYDLGWRGIHVEPTDVYANLLRNARPDEIVVQSAISSQHGLLKFYEIQDTGLSTASSEIAETHRSQGFQILETVVSTVTLADIFSLLHEPVVHWLKIDVEGLEDEVIDSWGTSPVRPWIVVVESTYPNSSREIHQVWEPKLLARKYTYAQFDGLNRYYVADEHSDLIAKLAVGPNYFDRFQLTEDMWAFASARHRLHAETSVARDDAVAARNELHQVHQQLLHEKNRNSASERQQLEAIARLQITHERNLEEKRQELSSELLSLKRIHSKEIGEARRAAEEKISNIRTECDRRQDEMRNLHQVEQTELAEHHTATQNDLEYRIHCLTASLDKVKRVEIPNFKREIDSRINTISTLTRELESRQSQYAKLEDQAAQLQYQVLNLRELSSRHTKIALFFLQQYETLTSRISWRVTSPLRWISRSVFPNAMSEINDVTRQTLGYKGELFTPLDQTFAKNVRFSEASVLHPSETPSTTVPLRQESGYAAMTSPQIEYSTELDHLLSLNDSEFLKQAYQLVLGRDPDENGKETYGSLLRNGISRSSIIISLCNSEEGRKHRKPEWARVLIQAEQANGNWLKRLFRGRRIAEQNLRVDLRALSLKIDSVQTSLSILHRQAAATVQIQRDIAELSRTVRRLVKQSTPVSDSPLNKIAQYEDAMEKFGSFLPLDRDAVPNLRERLDDFLYGTFPVEDHGNGPVRWTGDRATLKARITGRRLTVLAASPFRENSIQLICAGRVVKDQAIGFDMTDLVADVSPYLGREIDIDIVPQFVTCPIKEGLGADMRKLGVIVGEVYCD
ncbi:FkbM family methyltransferase [Asticcacaulis benevestitus]|uniref:Methyltransferase FkbM domain-containing protein n=1 Tax=Asticcacaulis benevestitus DSM 16100 = ATCC BAA-896 TaxID=1121022 RepID=V4Q002_9CAUL|nr:FkbM family methyltransferase [Asticcacaulis benevestitus]ESQ91130.1 hypothetical protein ABENE_10760 [Asticcacaulis benevestitus DSM 16100 = ATCC BAA-896]